MMNWVRSIDVDKLSNWLIGFGFTLLIGVIVYLIIFPPVNPVVKAVGDIQAQGYGVISYAEIKTCRAISCETTSLLVTTLEGNHQCFIDGSAPVCIPLAEGQLPR